MKKSYTPRKSGSRGEIRYKHDLGQHFLYDEALLRSLVASTGIGKEDAVLEIGPGAGTLTKCLCEAAGKVVAVEVDHDILPFLRAATEKCENLTVVEGDIRKLNLSELCAPLGEHFSVIANIPYNITTPIFDLLWESGLSIRQISVMVQKEVALKLLAQPKDELFGLLSVKCAYHCRGTLVQEVPAELFSPPPKVDSAFVKLDMREAPPAPVADKAKLWRFIKAGFTLRRKTLANALKGLAEPEKISAALAEMKLSPTVRGEALTIEQWIDFANRC